MARYINGMPANTPEEKKAAIEATGGNYNENIQGDYIQHTKGTKQTTKKGYVDQPGDGNKTPGTGNYTESIG
jgi:hypothetical protein